MPFFEFRNWWLEVSCVPIDSIIIQNLFCSWVEALDFEQISEKIYLTKYMSNSLGGM